MEQKMVEVEYRDRDECFRKLNENGWKVEGITPASSNNSVSFSRVHSFMLLCTKVDSSSGKDTERTRKIHGL